MSTSRVPESSLQSYILAQLSLLRPHAYFWRQNTGYASTRGGRGVRFGIPGQADITGVVNGRRVEIEVKTATGKQSPEQRAFQDSVEAAGGIYILARTLDDAIAPVRVLLNVGSP